MSIQARVLLDGIMTKSFMLRLQLGTVEQQPNILADLPDGELDLLIHQLTATLKAASAEQTRRGKAL